MSEKQLMNADRYCLIIFPTTHKALHAEKVLGQGQVPFLVVPTPREISAGCGLAVRFYCDDYQRIIEILNAGSIAVDSYYRVEKGLEKNIVSSVRLLDK